MRAVHILILVTASACIRYITADLFRFVGQGVVQNFNVTAAGTLSITAQGGQGGRFLNKAAPGDW